MRITREVRTIGESPREHLARLSSTVRLAVMLARGLPVFWSIQTRRFAPVVMSFLVGCSQSDTTQRCVESVETELVRIKDLDPNEPDSTFALRFANVSNPDATYPVQDSQPYAPSNSCEFQLGVPDSVTIQILTTMGDPVCERVDLYLERGSYRFKALPAGDTGVYFVTLTLGRVKWTKKIVLMR